MMFRHLEAFVETARTGSVTLAAETLLVTQPTVSGQLRELEEELGVPLFNRLPRGVELSEAGKRFLPRAKEILSARKKLLEEASDYKGLLLGTLELHASNVPGEYLLPVCIAHFKKAHPSLRIVMKIHDSRETIEAIQRGDAYLGVVGGSVEDPDLEFFPIWDDRIYLYGSAKAQFPETVTLQELAALPLVMREEGSASRLTVLGALKEAGLDLNAIEVVAELGSTTAVKKAVAAGIGASFLSEISALEELEAGLFRKIEVTGLPLIERRFYLVRHAKRELPPSARAFCEYALQKAASCFN
jgi:DNA-binding transcriptional LysR family regulator